jgi:ABC-type bacteriocin/lantibiotic exporter with double-glycine peptidase domain
VVLILCGFILSSGNTLSAQSSAIWLDVPFIKQEKDGCGAASIAMVMQYWLRQQGRSSAVATADAAHIDRALYSGRSHRIFASQIEHYFQQSGFRTFTIRGEWEDLQQHLQKGRPLIVALKPGAAGDLHYVVVTGLDSLQDLVLINDPAQRKLLKQDRASFDREWSATGKWTLLAVPGDLH